MSPSHKGSLEVNGANRLQLVEADEDSPTGLKLIVPEKTAEFLAAGGYDEKFGVRPLRRLVQHSIEDAAAELILDGRAGEGSTLSAETVGGSIKLFVV